MSEAAMIEKYFLCSSKYLHNMAETVNSMISEGWQPIGGIAVERGTRLDNNKEGQVIMAEYTLYQQAMVKYA